MKLTAKRPKFKPTKKLAMPPPKRPKTRRAVTGDPFEDYHFEITRPGVPAFLHIQVKATNGRDAVGAAYLVADYFATEAMAVINKNSR